MRYKSVWVFLLVVGLCHMVQSQRWQEKKNQNSEENDDPEEEPQTSDLDVSGISAFQQIFFFNFKS